MSLGALEAFHHAVQGRLDDRVPLLLLHKTGGDETELLPFAAATAPDRAVIALRGPVIEEGRPRFFRRIAPGVFDEPALSSSTWAAIWRTRFSPSRQPLRSSRTAAYLASNSSRRKGRPASIASCHSLRARPRSWSDEAFSERGSAMTCVWGGCNK